MTEKSETEHIDLNSDVVLGEPETNEVNGVKNESEEAVMGANRLNGQNGDMGSLVDGEMSEVEDGGVGKESLDSEVGDKVTGGEDEKMGDFSSKEGGEERIKGQDCAGKDGVSLDCTEGGVATAVSEAVSPSVEAGLDKEISKGGDLMGNDKKEEVAFEVEKEKAFDKMERNEHVEKGLVDGLDKLEAPGSVSDVLRPQSTGTTEAARCFREDVPVVEVEENVDRGVSLVERDSKTEPSDGRQNVALNLKVDLDAQTGESASFNIVIDISPRMGTERKVKSAALKPEFAIGDLIWGKVRSHPWWPGQICDPSTASRKAKKYFKRDGYLIAYFGDHTFAWNDASRIKPFLTQFSQMEKQSNTEDFHYAMACVLEEVSRRVEFGLACSCISEEVYAKLKSQIIINAGIREDSSRRDGGDRSLTVASFEPIKLIEYTKELAQVPYDETDKLQLTIARSQLLAFNRRKGYSQLPEFSLLGGLLENDADICPSGEKKHCNEVSGAVDPEQKDDVSVFEQGKSKSPHSSSLKHKLTSEDNALPRKKDKILKDLIEEKQEKTPKSKNGSESKVNSKKRKAGKVLSDDLPLKEKKSTATGVDNKSSQLKPTFRVGESIRRVASQLNGSSPILKNEDGMPKSPLVQTKSKVKIMSEESKTGKLDVEGSPDEVLSQLCLAATDPLSANNFSMITFFSEFRNTVSLGLASSEDDEESLEDLFSSRIGKKSTKSGRKSNKPGFTELPPLETMKESYWSERIVRSIPDPEDQNETEELLPGTRKKGKARNSPSESQKLFELNSEQQTAGENLETEAEKPMADLNNSCTEDLSQTALILNFTDLDSVPSETNLNKIFSRYGPLNELETEVFKKSSRAKVVFRKRSDAETAFSSAGKYSTFGPSLVSYRLKYLQSTPSKASPNPRKRSKTLAESAEDNAKLSTEL
ncbi:PWWP domain containing protein [Parasponia andersonii]|uniref:PWWP domain containing protein n=1 Tax=Parasponia andersonii TaxID=3476 RepID=A0A2P5D7G5_PARAD|nr:PWWP domain containing protein [Parasponia andersonii]